MQAVNETMRKEAVSGSLIQKAWRPFNGFAFGITLFCDYVLVPAIILAILLFKDNPLPEGASFEWDHIPLGVYVMWTTVLGIAGVSRGVEKVKTTKQLNGEGASLLEFVKTMARGAIGK